jgi:phosphoesterase RecJ-like protein
MPLDWSLFVDIARRHQRFLLTTHVRPDGDGLGSMLALAETLEARGKQTRLVVASAIPARYNFLDAEQKVQRFQLPGEECRQADVAVVLDTGTWNQLGDFGAFLRQLTVPKVVIDHHQTQDDLGAVRLVDTTAEATGRLVYEAIRALGATPSPRAANRLFVALAMDTGWFRHNNTTPETLTLAAELVRCGANPTVLYEHLFEQSSLARLKLTGLVLGRIGVTPDGLIAHSELRREDYEATGATPQDTEDLINFVRSVASVEVALFFMEQPRGGVKVSFRSRSKVDVAKVAEAFGGGGHRLASGAVVQGDLADVKSRVLAVVNTALQA